MNVCQLKHDHHDVKKVDTVQGQFFVYDVEKYKNNPGFYCTGQDALSENIIIEGQWEPHDTKRIKRILERGQGRGYVIDFGCHVGWYSIMAAKLGYHVLAIDGDAENLKVLELNAEFHNVRDKIKTVHAWVDDKFKLSDLPAFESSIMKRAVENKIQLIKVDLEGNDTHAMRSCDRLLARCNNLYVEITPVFNDSYPALVSYLRQKRFDVYYPDGTPFNDDYSESQINLWFKKK